MFQGENHHIPGCCKFVSIVNIECPIGRCVMAVDSRTDVLSLTNRLPSVI